MERSASGKLGVIVLGLCLGALIWTLLSVYLGEHRYAFIAYPDTRAWFLFGLFVNALVPTWLFTAAGAFTTYLVSRRRMRRG